jgi:hypothetical protein
MISSKTFQKLANELEVVDNGLMAASDPELIFDLQKLIEDFGDDEGRLLLTAVNSGNDIGVEVLLDEFNYGFDILEEAFDTASQKGDDYIAKLLRRELGEVVGSIIKRAQTEYDFGPNSPSGLELDQPAAQSVDYSGEIDQIKSLIDQLMTNDDMTTEQINGINEQLGILDQSFSDINTKVDSISQGSKPSEVSPVAPTTVPTDKPATTGKNPAYLSESPLGSEYGKATTGGKGFLNNLQDYFNYLKDPSTKSESGRLTDFGNFLNSTKNIFSGGPKKNQPVAQPSSVAQPGQQQKPGQQGGLPGDLGKYYNLEYQPHITKIPKNKRSSITWEELSVEDLLSDK